MPDGKVYHHLEPYSKIRIGTISDAFFNSISNNLLMEMDKIKGLDKALKAGREKELSMIPNKDSFMRTPSNKMQELLNEAKKLINP